MGWHVKTSGGYVLNRSPSTALPLTSILTQEGIDNAREIIRESMKYGVSFNSACGTVGCMIREANLNPWSWEQNASLWSTYAPTKQDIDNTLEEYRGRGYGLCQWTPPSAQYVSSSGVKYRGKYINSEATSLPYYGPNFYDVTGNPLDGVCQINFLWNISVYRSEWLPNSAPAEYSMDLETFKTNTGDPGFLSVVFTANYLRAATGVETAPYLRRLGTSVYDYFTENPITPEPPATRRKMPLYMMCGRPQRRIIWR